MVNYRGRPRPFLLHQSAAPAPPIYTELAMTGVAESMTDRRTSSTSHRALHPCAQPNEWVNPAKDCHVQQASFSGGITSSTIQDHPQVTASRTDPNWNLRAHALPYGKILSTSMALTGSDLLASVNSSVRRTTTT